MAVNPTTPPGTTKPSTRRAGPGAPGQGAPGSIETAPPRPGSPSPSASTRAARCPIGSAGPCSSGSCRVWFRPRVRGRGNVPESGPAIIAPVHRSNLDFGFTPFVTNRKLFFMAKEELWKVGWFGRILDVLRRLPGAPVRGRPRVGAPSRGGAAAGPAAGHVPRGVPPVGGPDRPAAWRGWPSWPPAPGRRSCRWASRGTERAMPKGAKFPKPLGVTVSIGEPIAVPSSRGRPPGRPEPDPPADRDAAGAPPGRLRRRGALSDPAATLAEPGLHHDAGVAEPEEQVGPLLGAPRGPGSPHRRALGDPPAPRDGGDQQLGRLVLALLEPVDHVGQQLGPRAPGSRSRCRSGGSR